ncbi:FtsK/SpoIIIE domain-containing protein [Streptomyces albidoflavus]|uniref:FtsK/SpoIIIE domain-containing protein n=1 Tax=Streptomyces albidoflavus TaxID=1886 RepID=UPI0033F706F9
MTDTLPETPMGTVHHLDDHRPERPPISLVKPTTPEPTTPDAPVEGEAPARVSGGRRVVRGLRTVVTSERTRASVRATARHGAYVVGGARIVTRRAWDSRSAARYERMIRAAEAAGNHELAREWEERGRAFRTARHQRRMELLSAPERLAKGAAAGVGVAGGGLLLLGIILAVANENFADIATPTLALVELVRWIVVIVSVVWGPLVTLAPWLGLLALWGVGRHQQAAPQWALPTSQRDTGGAPITPSIVVTALRDLGVPALRKAIKEMGDAGAAMLGPIRIAGCGVEVDVTLPSGVSTNEVQDRRRKLAENLARHEHEVFITIPEAARTVRLWIADSGALDEPIGPSPLVMDATMTAHYKKGKAPWGRNLRGDAAELSVYQRHLLITGRSNQGKTAALRSLALWLALDPTVQFWIADLKGVGDWSMFDGIADVLIEGPSDDHVIQATEMVEAAVEEMNRRIEVRRNDPSATFPPLPVIVDEAQVAFMCPVKSDDGRYYGGAKATSRYFMAVRQIHNQGRAVDVLMWQGTQDPTDQNLPKLVREGAHTRASLVLGTETQSRMALGDKAVDDGAAPHMLRQGLDRGTLVVSSDGIEMPTGQSFLTVRTHFVDDDPAKEIAHRAKELRHGVTTRNGTEQTEERDALTDIATVIGDAPRLRTNEVLKRLHSLAPKVYGDQWTNDRLKGLLEDHGEEPKKSHGVMVIHRDHVLRALANRDTDGSASASA